MNYINLEEDLRIGYAIYSNDTIGLDYVTGSNNLYTTGYATGMIDLEDLADELIDEVSLLDYCKLSEDNIEDVETTIFYEEEWEDYTKGLNNTQVLEGLREEDIILEDLTEVLSDLTVFELYHGRDVIMDMIEEGIINQFLKDKEVVQGVWRGYSQGDYLEYYAIIEFTTEDEREKEKRNIEEIIEYTNLILSGDTYDVRVTKEKLYIYKEIEGDKIAKIWEEESEDYFEFITDKSLEKEIKCMLKDLTEKKYHKIIDTTDLTLDVIY